jgi:hypothetical protein
MDARRCSATLNRPAARAARGFSAQEAGPNYIGEMQIARYFAVGVEQAPDGEFIAGKCDEAQSALWAVRKARSIAHQNGGAIAFRWRGDIEFGRPGSIEILAAFGELPPEVKGLMREARRSGAPSPSKSSHDAGRA